MVENKWGHVHPMAPKSLRWPARLPFAQHVPSHVLVLSCSCAPQQLQPPPCCSSDVLDTSGNIWNWGPLHFSSLSLEHSLPEGHLTCSLTSFPSLLKCLPKEILPDHPMEITVLPCTPPLDGLLPFLDLHLSRAQIATWHAVPFTWSLIHCSRPHEGRNVILGAWNQDRHEVVKSIWWIN